MQHQTMLVHPGRSDREPTGASSTPIYQSATFAADEESRWDYSRSGNPTREVLERQLTLLDGAQHGFAFASGVAALAAVFRLVPPGGRIACGADVYGGTFRLLDLLGRDHGWDVRFFDLAADDFRELRAFDADLLLAEIPSNPLLLSTDVRRIRAEVGPQTRIVVDHSMLSPLLLQPLSCGADVALQSGTKLLGGHGDLTAGVVCVNDDALAAELKFRQNAEGTALAPFECWLLIRGLQTLPLRLKQQLATTRAVLETLRSGGAVEGVFYPPHPEHACPVVSFSTGSVEASRRFVRALQLFRTTVSFGSVFSSASMPCEMSHASVPERLRKVASFPPDIVRLSIGIEAEEDIVGDVVRALDVVEVVDAA